MKINKSRIKKKTSAGIIIFIKILILTGICFVVLYPQFEKLAISFMSVDDLKTRAGVNKNVIETLRENGCLNGLSETSQLSLFDMMQ